MRNKELVDKRFMQISGKIKTLEFLLSRQSSKKEFMGVVKELGDTVEDLRSLIDRETSPLRNG